MMSKPKRQLQLRPRLAGPRSARPRSARQRGVTTLLVILTLIFVTSLLGVMLRQNQVGVKQRRLIEQKSQAHLLTESGIERAVAKAKADAEYSSEDWRISAGEFGGRFSALVQIAVDRTTSPAQVSIVATYPIRNGEAEPGFSSKVRKQVFVELSSNESVSESIESGDKEDNS